MDARHILPIKEGDILPKGMTEEAYALAFMREFGLKSLDDSLLYRLPQVELPLQISKALFLDKQTRKLKANKSGRGPYLRLLAQAIKNPYEIWQNIVEINGRKRTVLRFLRLFKGEGKEIGGFGSFTLLDGRMWTGSTVFNPKGENREAMLTYLEQQRQGVLVWREK